MAPTTTLEYRNLLTFEENRYFYTTLNRKSYRKNEPLDEDISIVKPGKIRSLLDLIFKNQLLSLNDFLNHYYLDRVFLEDLFGFENKYLAQYGETLDREYFTNSNVVPLFSQKI